MKNCFVSKKRYWLSINVFLTLNGILFPYYAFALELNYPHIPGAPSPQDLPSFITYLFYLIVYISGILVLTSLIIAGFRYFFSFGNPEKILSAKEQISSAFLGLLIILSSFIILKTIHPQFVEIEKPKIKISEPQKTKEIKPPPLKNMVSVISTEIPLGKIIQERIFQRVIYPDQEIIQPDEDKDNIEKKIGNINQCQFLNPSEEKEEEKPRMTRIKTIAENTLALAEKLKEYAQNLKNAAEQCACSQVTPICSQNKNIGKQKLNKDKSLGYLFAQSTPNNSPSPSPDYTMWLTAQPDSGPAPLQTVVTIGLIIPTDNILSTSTANITLYCNRSDDGTNIEETNWDRRYNDLPLNWGGVVVTGTCIYEEPGTYTIKTIIEIEMNDIVDEERVNITVSGPPPTPEPPTPEPPTPGPPTPEPPTPEPTPEPTPKPPTPGPPTPGPPSPGPPTCPISPPIETSPEPEEKCTCDPCKNVRGIIQSNQNNSLKAIYQGLTINSSEGEEIKTSLRTEQRKAADEIRLLKEELDKLERAESLMFECGLSSLKNLSTFLAEKNLYLSQKQPYEISNFWDNIRVKEDWASFYCPVSGTIWESEQPISFLRSSLGSLFSDDDEESKPIQPSAALSCTSEMPVGELIKRTKQISNKLIERLEKLIDLDESLIKAMSDLFVLISQCSSTRCKPVCEGSMSGDPDKTSATCVGDPCPLEEIRNKYQEIVDIVEGKASTELCGPCGDFKEPEHKQFKDECIPKRQKEGIKDIVSGERKKSIKAKRDPSCREQIGIKALIEETIPTVNRDLQLMVRDRMKNCASSIGSFFGNCSELKNEIGPDNRLIKYCCYDQKFYTDCQSWCQYDTGFKKEDKENQEHIYKECMYKCLKEKEKEYHIPDISHCRNLLNFYCCSAK